MLTIIYSYIFVSMKREKEHSSTLPMQLAILQLSFSLNGLGMDPLVFCLGDVLGFGGILV